MRIYWELAKAGFRRYSRYRQAAVASALTNTVFGLIRASLLVTAIRTTGHPIGGYDALAACTYVWLSQALIGPLDVWGSSVDIGERIKSGDVTTEFLRPSSILGSALATNYGRGAFEFLPRSIPILIIGWLITGIRLPSSPLAYVLGFVSLLMASALCYTYFFILQLAALWTGEYRGFTLLGMSIQQILCGFIVPVTWFPGWLLAIDRWLPFPSMFQTTADLLTSTTIGTAAIGPLALQAAWLVALVGLCQLLLAAGRRWVVVQGG